MLKKVLDLGKFKKKRKTKNCLYRGYSIPQCQELLPNRIEEPLAEGMLWLLLTGELPTKQQVDDLTQDLHARSAVPDNVATTILGLSPS